jgi:SAM-dependent methyltransferase
LERYSVEMAIDLARRLNVIDYLSQWRSVDDLCRLLSFQSSFKFALHWILERLVETDCIEARTDGNTRFYHLRHTLRQPDLESLRAAGLQIDPANAATLDLLDHAASLYPVVANGEQTGDHNLLGPQGVPLWLNYFHNDNLTYAVNNWVGAALAAERVSSRRALRILEVGAGPGSASEILLRVFDERGLLPRVERYLVTEPNAFFLRCSQRKLARQHPDLPFEWGALNLDLPWSNQGINPGEFDLIYAVNVMHISKDLLFSLNEARSALGNDGWLVIGECLRPYFNQPIYPELMFQILESFTNVQTDPEIRPNPGFLTAEDWRRAFSRAGFQRAEVAPNIDRIREIYPHFFTGAICGQNVVPNK